MRANFALGADGLAMLMLLLTGIVLTVAAISSFSITDKRRGYHALFLLLCLAVPGCFAALDAFLFYVFFEVMLIPMYFLVGLWGGPRREFAAIQFFIYTLAGSLLILAGFAVCYLFANPSAQLTVLHLPNQAAAGWGQTVWPGHLGGATLAQGVFWLLLIGFLVKLPAVPLHTWLPLAHTEAPTPVSVMLAGVLLKAGGFGIMRWVLPLFPAQAALAGPAMALLGGISIVYAAMLALGTLDLKRMIACSSVSHMGFVLLGLATGRPEGTAGAAYQMFSHGIISAGLFVLAGAVQARVGSRQLDAASGLATLAPRLAVCMACLFFAGMGLPGFSGFVGEFLVLVAALGAGAAGTISYAGAVLGLAGLLITTGFFLWALRRVVMGTPYIQGLSVPAIADLAGRELWLLAVLIVLSVVFGLVPGLVLDRL